jgi:type II secretory pathway pseudopilin PulG
VIVILAILAAIVVFAVQGLTVKGASASCQADFKTVETAGETFKTQVGAYPDGDSSTHYYSGTSVKPFSGALPTGVAAGASNAGILELMGTADVNGTTVGPWLKDFPYNAGHYQLDMPANGNADISVYNTAAPPEQVPSSGATGSISDCSSVTG